MADSKSLKEDYLDPIAKRVHTVSFNTSTSSALIDPIPVRHGAAVERIEVEKPYCELVDWYVDRDLRKAYDFSLPVIADMVLYAKWKYVGPQHMVSFCSDRTLDVFVDQGQAVIRPPDPVKKGYKFVGWYLTDMPDEAFYYLFDTPVVNTFALWAVWDEATGSVIEPIRPIKG